MDVEDTALTNPVVVYGANAAYVRPALVSIYSMQKNASRPVDVTLYLDGDVGPFEWGLIDHATNRLGLRLRAEVFDDSCFDAPEKVRADSRFPVISRLPLALPYLVQGRGLYIDADTLVIGDVNELLTADMDGQPIGACVGIRQLTLLDDRILKIRVSDFFRPAVAKIRREKFTYRVVNLGFVPREGNYFNSGLVVMDCDVVRDRFSNWRELCSVEKFLPYREFSADQDRLNEFFHGCWFELSLKWNTRQSLYRDLKSRRFRNASASIRSQMQEAVESPKMWHFIGKKKPWIRRYGNSRMLLNRKAYQDYAQMLAEFNAILA